MAINNLSDSLINTDIKILQDIFEKEKSELIFVGGCVRDSLLDEIPHDIDLCTNLTPDEMIALFKEKGIPTLEIGKQYGTITAMINNTGYEITTYRADGEYSDGRHPDSISFAKDFKTDVMRRDFTINGMGYDAIQNKIIDYTGGQKDLENGVIRCIGDPDKRFQEDSLRILRAMRFSIKYGFKIDEKTAEAMHRNKGLLEKVSKERITQEFEKMLTCGKPIKNAFMEFSDVIAQVIPEIKPCIGFEQHNRWHNHDVYEHSLDVVDLCGSNDFSIRLAALLHDISKPACYSEDENGQGHMYGHPEKGKLLCEEMLPKRFALDNETLKKVLLFVQDHERTIAPTEKSIRKYASANGYDNLRDLMQVKMADAKAHIVPEGEKPLMEKLELAKILEMANALEKSEGQLTVRSLNINGNDMVKAGFERGPELGKSLNTLLDKVINGQIPNEHKALMNEAYRIYNNYKKSLEREPLKVTLMIGIPGSGKSTYAQNMNAVRVCPDEVRKKLYGDISAKGDGNEISNEIRRQVRSAVKKGQDFIFDATNSTKKARERTCRMIRNIAENNGYRVSINGIYIKTPINTCLERNAKRGDRSVPVPEEVIEKMFQNLQDEPPAISDGMDTLTAIEPMSKDLIVRIKEVKDEKSSKTGNHKNSHHKFNRESMTK